MAGAGGHWSKGKFHPAVAKKKVTVAQVATIRRESRPVVARVQLARPRPQMGQSTARPKMTQTGMFSQGEDTPLFSGASQRGEVDAYKARQAARQERLRGDFDAHNPAKHWTRQQTTYTPEYEEAKRDQERIRQKSGMSHDELMKQDSQYRDATNRLDQEREISQAAREHGYDPQHMSKKDWADLSDKLADKAKKELRHADESDREAVGHKMRGKADTWSQVGGEARLVRSGASKKQAGDKVRSLNRATRNDADEYMGKRLVEFGYSSEKVDRLSYEQKRRLMAEIGHGEVQKTKVSDISYEERAKVVNSASTYRQRDAKDIALNPRAGQGLQTWGQSMTAAEKAGKDVELPPDYLYDNARKDAPRYVKRSNAHSKYQDDSFVF